MKVNFECEICGHQWAMQVEPGTTFTAVHHDCPKTKLTYGPLTEEMVAEALTQVVGVQMNREWAFGDRSYLVARADFGEIARFILRLLNKTGPETVLGNPERDHSSPMEWRAWLLDLARKP